MLLRVVERGEERGLPREDAHLFLAEEADEMLAIRSDAPSPATSDPVPLADVPATIARWLGLAMPASPGRPILALDPVGP